MFAQLKKIFGAKPSSPTRLRPGQPGYQPGTILFVDDEPEVRSIARQALEPLGYTLIEAEDGAKALEIFQKRSSEIGLVVTDVLMPNLDGLGLSARLHKLDPALPILLLSGHVLEEDLWAEGNARMRYLMKPYRLQDLHGIIVDLIGAAPQPGKGPSA